MNDILMRLRAWAWWLVPMVLLLAVLALETNLGSALYVHPAAEEHLVAKPVVVSLMPEYAISGGITKRTETVERPLFNPTRRPAPVVAVEATKHQMMQHGQFALTGTTLSGERNLAFLKELNGGKARTVKQGDTINGMLVAEVTPDRVKLTLDDESEVLVLKVVANPKTTPQPVVPAAAQPPGHPPVPNGQVNGATPVANAEPRTLADRRRARQAEAMAAQAQQRQQQAEEASAQSTREAMTTAVPPDGPATPAPSPDQGWGAVFQRYQQRK